MEYRGRHASAITYGYWTGLEVEGYEWTFHPDATTGAIPTNGDQVCVFVSATPDHIGRGGMDVIESIVRASAPDLADRLQAAEAPVAPRTFAAARASSAERGAMAGRWLATLATSRTRSAPMA